MESQTQNMDLGPLYEMPPVEFEFTTIGWKVVGVLAILFLMWAAFSLIRNYVKNAYRREAILMISNIEKQFEKTEEVECVQEVLTVLKLVALRAYNRDEVAVLHGENWMAYLDSKSKKTDFATFNDFVQGVLYKNELTQKQEANAFINESKKWIKYHVA